MHARGGTARGRTYFLRQAAALVVGCLGLATLPAQVEEPAAEELADDFEDLSLEELLEVEVTVVTHKQIKVGTAPAALYVITRQDIQRSGMTSIPELLRLVPGMHVAKIDSNRWAIGARGFVGEFTNKLLVLIDGRRVYSPLFGGVHWDVQDVNLEDVERIEVIRGPGGVRWGANAVNGVIHVITRRSYDTQGGMVQTTIGSEDRAIATLRYGGEIDENTTWRAYARYLDRDEQVFADGSDATDGGELARAAFRFDGRDGERDLWSVDADVYVGSSRSRAQYTLNGPPYVETADISMPLSGGHLQGEWSPLLADGHTTRFSGWLDINNRDVPGLLNEHRQTLAFEALHILPDSEVGRISFGGGYRYQRLDLDGSSRASTSDPHNVLNVVDAFIQDELELGDVSLFLGTKLEYNEFVGLQVQPDVRASWQIDEGWNAWAAVSRAVRTPTFVEDDLRLDVSSQPGPGGVAQVGQLVSNKDFDAEELLSYEGGFRARPSEALFFDLALFYGDYDQLDERVLGTPMLDPSVPRIEVPLLVDNVRTAKSYGAELSARWMVGEDTSLAASYSFARVEEELTDPNAVVASLPAEGSYPRHQAQLHLHQVLTDEWSGDLHAYYYGDAPATGIDAWLRLDLHLGWRPKDDLRLDFTAQNLLDDRHPEFPGEFFGATTEVERSVLFTVTHRF